MEPHTLGLESLGGLIVDRPPGDMDEVIDKVVMPGRHGAPINITIARRADQQRVGLTTPSRHARVTFWGFASSRRSRKKPVSGGQTIRAPATLL